MQANPDKFQVLAVRKKTYEKRPTINIQNLHYWPLFVVFCLISMILVTRPNDLKLHKLTICLGVWHVVGNQKPLKGPSELMLQQGSILGPLLFNVFINDIFLFIKDSSLYNYADDNTLSFNNFCLGLHANLLEVWTTWSGIHVHVGKHTKKG
jgi:hypothetical protein